MIVEHRSSGALRPALAHAVGVLLILALAACASFRIGEPYDKTIEGDLNAFQKSAVAFITSMQLNAASPSGRYDSAEAKAYYASAESTLANLQLRADLLSGRACPIGKVAALVASLPAVAPTGALHDAEVRLGLAASGSGALDTSGNCIAIVVRGVHLAELDLQGDHMTIGHLAPQTAQLDAKEISDAVRVALLAIRSRNF